MTKEESSKDAGKKPRRVKGEGSVYQRKSDGRWVASVPLGNGKKKIQYFDTRKEAEQAKRKALNELEHQTLVATRDQTLKDYLEYWLGIQQTVLKVGSYSTYHRFLTLFIIPALGHVKLQKLTSDMFQSLYIQWKKEGVAPNTIRFIHAVIGKALGDAVKSKKLSFNPAKDATPPREEKRGMTVLDLDQAKVLLAHAQDTKLECLLQVALLGLRRGELLGLRWQDINFERAELKVQRSLSYIANPDTGHYEYVEHEPKTSASRRVISLPRFIVEALLKHREAQLQKKASSSQWRENNLVFCNGKGEYMNPANLITEFKHLLKQAGLPEIRFHDLRHSAASIWLALGMNPKVIQELLGHSNIHITLDVYSHVLPTMHREAMNSLDASFRKEQE
jgi:integrase